MLTSTATWHELLPIGVFPRRQTVAAPDEDARPRRRLYITSCISSSRRNTYELTRSIGLRLDGISQLPPGWFSNDTRELKPFLACVNRVKPSLRQTVAAVGFNEGWPTFYLIIFTSRRAATLSWNLHILYFLLLLYICKHFYLIGLCFPIPVQSW